MRTHKKIKKIIEYGLEKGGRYFRARCCYIEPGKSEIQDRLVHLS